VGLGLRWDTAWHNRRDPNWNPSHRSREELSHNLVSGFAGGSIAVNAVAVNLNTNVKKNMKTLHVAKPIHRSPLRCALLLIAPALVIIGVLTAVPARATPACGLASETLALGHFPSGSLNLMCNEFRDFGWFFKTNVRGDSDVYVVRNTWPVEAHSGWHTHPGPSLITVLSGELTVYDADSCAAPIVYHAGESFTDIGCGDVHLIRNEGTVCAVNMVVQIVQAGLPRRIDADQPANCPTFTCASPTPCPQ
jgi:quercetin dioxygenase-like cupin family protein